MVHVCRMPRYALALALALALFTSLEMASCMAFSGSPLMLRRSPGTASTRKREREIESHLILERNFEGQVSSRELLRSMENDFTC